MRIGILLPSDNMAGPQKLAAVLASDLAEHGHDVEVVIPRTPYYAYDVTIRRRPHSWARVAARYLFRYVRHPRFSFEDLLPASAARSRIRVRNVLRNPSRRVLHRLDCLLTMSVVQAMDTLRRSPRTTVVYYVLHPEEISLGPELKAPLRSLRRAFPGAMVAASPWTAGQVGDHTREPPIVPIALSRIFWNGRGSPEEGQRTTDLLLHYDPGPTKDAAGGLQLLREIRRLRPRTTLTVWSRGGKPPADGDVAVGTLSEPELRQLYRSHRILVFPSTMEGFGLPPLEALACGCVSVLRPRVGAEALYAKDGVNTVHFGSDVSATARRVIDILDHSETLDLYRGAGYAALDPFNPDGYGERLLAAAGLVRSRPPPPSHAVPSPLPNQRAL